MAEDGWIKLHRKIRNNILWKKKPFDKPRAWIDLLLRASHNNRNILAGNRRIELKRGQIFVSKKRLARDWGWSRTKVTNFLNVLEGKNRNKGNQMLTTSEPLCKNETPKKTPFGIIITLTNYEFYQTGIMKKDTQKDIKKTPKRHPKDTPPISNAEQEKVSKSPKNYKNVKNYKERTIILRQIENLLHQFPPDIQGLAEEYVELVRLANKTQRIGLHKNKRLVAELFYEWSACDSELLQEDFRCALRTAVNNEAPHINYVKKVMKSNIRRRKIRLKRGAERDAHN